MEKTLERLFPRLCLQPPARSRPGARANAPPSPRDSKPVPFLPRGRRAVLRLCTGRTRPGRDPQGHRRGNASPAFCPPFPARRLPALFSLGQLAALPQCSFLYHAVATKATLPVPAPPVPDDANCSWTIKISRLTFQNLKTARPWKLRSSRIRGVPGLQNAGRRTSKPHRVILASFLLLGPFVERFPWRRANARILAARRLAGANKTDRPLSVRIGLFLSLRPLGCASLARPR